MNVDSEKIRTTRQRLGWTVADLARRAAISLKAAEAIEAGNLTDSASLVRVRAAIEAAGNVDELHAGATAEGMAEVNKDPFDG